MKKAIFILTALSFCHATASAQGVQEAPGSLTPANFNQLADYIKLKPADENYQRVTWHSTVLKGQQLAQQSDKPLLLWLYFGDPRANC